LSWGAGDIAACQGCGHSFVPLGHGLQDGDLALLRAAVQQMRVQTERAEYLEQALNSLQASPLPPPRGSPGSSRSMAHHRRSPRRESPVALGGNPPCFLSPIGSPTAKSSTARPAEKAEREKPATAGDPLQPRLVSLMDTVDLLTNSSVSSADVPCFNGSRLRHRQATLDTLQNIKHNVDAAVFSAHREDGECSGAHREDGECTSASVSDGEISSSSSLRRTPRLWPRILGGTPSHWGATPRQTSGTLGQGRQHSKSLPCRALSRGGMTPVPHAATACMQDAHIGSSPLAWLGLRSGCAAELQAAAGQLLLFIASLAVRAGLCRIIGSAAAPALLTAMLSSGALAAWRSAQWCLEIETQRLMDTDTSSDPKSLLAAALGRTGLLNIRFGGQFFPRITLNLSIEDSLCLAVTCAQLALLFFFENWGVQGPHAYRWAAVAGHTVASLVLLIAARLWLLPTSADSNNIQDSTSGQCGGAALWVCLSLGHWGCSSWAAATWWHSAAVAAAEAAAASAAAAKAPAVGGVVEANLGEISLPHAPLVFPIVASAIMHVANVWNTSRAQKPVLLFVCVVLAGVSMAFSCCVYCGTPSAGWLGTHWRASVLPLFCSMSAWVLWQELVRPLSED